MIVGEARGEEVLALLNAMSQGTDGSMATLHASSSRGPSPSWPPTPCRLPNVSLLEATNLLVANAVHFVIHLAQDGQRRFVSSAREVVDAEGPMVVSNEVFRPGPDGRAVPGVPPRSETLDQLAAVGFEAGFLDRPQGWWKRDRLGHMVWRRIRTRTGHHLGWAARRRAAAAKLGFGPSKSGAGQPTSRSRHWYRGGRGGGDRLAGGSDLGRSGRLGCAGTAGRRQGSQTRRLARIEAVAGWALSNCAATRWPACSRT